jgi:hypothetical protein
MSIAKRTMCLTAFLRPPPNFPAKKLIFTSRMVSVYSHACAETQYAYHCRNIHFLCPENVAAHI